MVNQLIKSFLMRTKRPEERTNRLLRPGISETRLLTKNTLGTAELAASSTRTTVRMRDRSLAFERRLSKIVNMRVVRPTAGDSSTSAPVRTK